MSFRHNTVREDLRSTTNHAINLHTPSVDPFTLPTSEEPSPFCPAISVCNISRSGFLFFGFRFGFGSNFGPPGFVSAAGFEFGTSPETSVDDDDVVSVDGTEAGTAGMMRGARKPGDADHVGRFTPKTIGVSGSGGTGSTTGSGCSWGADFLGAGAHSEHHGST